MEICKHNKCTGCFSCVNKCPTNSISLCEDESGELHPFINDNSCIHCGDCIRVCPSNNEIPSNYPINCYAAWLLDNKKRNNCASGGAASVISEYFIRYKEGVVFGTAYDEALIPRIIFTDTLEGLEQFKGSKYVQSIVGENTYNKMKEYLDNGRNVLFISTPCQVAGAKTYLGESQNFFTIDLICHGVCPTKYFCDEIQYLKKRHGLYDIQDVRFRGNDVNNYRFSLWKSKRREDNNFVLTLWNKAEDGRPKRIYRSSAFNDYYLCSYLWGVSLRENCYSCMYAKPDRISDITVGDYIGIGKYKKYDKFDYDANNISCVLTNTTQGERLYCDLLNKTPDFISFKRDYKERLEYGASLRFPFKRHPLNIQFKKKYAVDHDFPFVIRKVLKGKMIKNGIRHILIMWIYVYRIPRKIVRELKKAGRSSNGIYRGRI